MGIISGERWSEGPAWGGFFEHALDIIQRYGIHAHRGGDRAAALDRDERSVRKVRTPQDRVLVNGQAP